MLDGFAHDLAQQKVLDARIRGHAEELDEHVNGHRDVAEQQDAESQPMRAIHERSL
jgi:hypothetical protein